MARIDFIGKNKNLYYLGFRLALKLIFQMCQILARCGIIRGKERIEMAKRKEESIRLPEYKAVIGIDESYANTGVALCINGEIIAARSLLAKEKNSMRLIVQNEMQSLLGIAKEKGISENEVAIVFERVRLFSNSFISTQYMVSMSYLNAAIIMQGHKLGIPCYSVDTKCWKSHVVGSSKPMENKYGVEPRKFLTLDYCMRNPKLRDFVVEYEENPRRQKKCYRTKDNRFARFNDNVADSICIAMFFHKVGARSAAKLLKLEE